MPLVKVLHFVSSTLYLVLSNSAFMFSVTAFPSFLGEKKKKAVLVYSEITLGKRMLNGVLSLLVNSLERCDAL